MKGHYSNVYKSLVIFTVLKKLIKILGHTLGMIGDKPKKYCNGALDTY
jgi:hypothetical protein